MPLKEAQNFFQTCLSSKGRLFSLVESFTVRNNMNPHLRELPTRLTRLSECKRLLQELCLSQRMKSVLLQKVGLVLE